MTRTYHLRNLERRLRYEERQALRAPSPESRERHVIRYMFYDRRYTNLVGKHYAAKGERA